MKLQILMVMILMPFLSQAGLIDVNGTFRGKTDQGEECYVRVSDRQDLLSAGYKTQDQGWVAFSDQLTSSDIAIEARDVLTLKGWAESTRYRLRLLINNFVVVKNIESANMKIGVFSRERRCLNMFRTLD